MPILSILVHNFSSSHQKIFLVASEISGLGVALASGRFRYDRLIIIGPIEILQSAYF